MRRSIVALGLLTLLSSPSAPFSGAPADDEQGAYAQVDLVFVLDTTGSMSGMIAATKQKIWSIVSALTEISSEPEIRLGFVAYRDRKDAYVTRRVPLTRDLRPRGLLRDRATRVAPTDQDPVRLATGATRPTAGQDDTALRQRATAGGPAQATRSQQDDRQGSARRGQGRTCAVQGPQRESCRGR